MASFQVEIATSSSPFVHNRRDSSCFHNDLNNMVSTSCIANDHNHNNANSPPPHIDFTDLWVHRPQWQSAPATTTATPTATATKNNRNHNNNNKKKHQDQGRDRELSNIDETPAYKHPKHSKWGRAREIVFSDKGSSCDSGSSNARGVSSLVQKWRHFEAEANCSGKKDSSSSSSTTTCQDAPAAPTCNEDDLFGDWESDRTVISGPPSSRGRESDATESEKLRVADIIRKLTEDIHRSAADVAPESAPHARTSLDHQSEQRSFSPLISSPSMRGRQIYHHLLMRMERDRRKELEGLVGRKAVSKFSHRGRIQAVLRIRFLRRGIEAHGGRHSNGASSVSHKAMQSAIAHFRVCEVKLEKGMVVLWEDAIFRNEEQVDRSVVNGSVHAGRRHKELADDTPAPDLYATNQQGKESQYQQVSNSKGRLRVGVNHILGSEGCITSGEHNVEHSSPKFTENMERSIQVPHNHEGSSLSTVMSQGTSWDDGNHNFVGSAGISKTFHDTDTNCVETMESLCSIEIKAHNQEREVTDEQVVKSNYLMNDSDHPQNYQEGESAYSNQDLVETATYWVSEVSHHEVGWEDFHSDYQQQESSNRDWMDEVSRPRSDWEGLRQARYQEMLDPFSDNEEIRMLLGRRSVSTFLSSDLREKIDQVMLLRTQGHETRKGNQTLAETDKSLFPEREQAVEKEEGEGNDRVDRQEEEENYGGYFDEYEEAESSIGNQYNESDDYMDYIISSPPASWTRNQGRESSDCSYHAPSPFMLQSSSDFCSRNNGSNTSCGAHPAIDMELIYDLRKHMEQLHQEMSELRRSIKCCMDMQFKLQRSIKKEVTKAPNHSGEKINGRGISIKKVKDAGRCCVCNKMQVDSLLYRCGHMCTCYKCAHELQLSNQKCPICAAPILDAIRTHPNHS